jgi:hypothetical protein
MWGVILIIILIIILFVVGLYLLNKGMKDRNSYDSQTRNKGTQITIIGIVVLIVAIIMMLPVGAEFQ